MNKNTTTFFKFVLYFSNNENFCLLIQSLQKAWSMEHKRIAHVTFTSRTKTVFFFVYLVEKQICFFYTEEFYTCICSSDCVVGLCA